MAAAARSRSLGSLRHTVQALTSLRHSTNAATRARRTELIFQDRLNDSGSAAVVSDHDDTMVSKTAAVAHHYGCEDRGIKLAPISCKPEEPELASLCARVRRLRGVLKQLTWMAIGRECEKLPQF